MYTTAMLQHITGINGNGCSAANMTASKVALYIKKMTCDVRSANIALAEHDIDSCRDL